MLNESKTLSDHHERIAVNLHDSITLIDNLAGDCSDPGQLLEMGAVVDEAIDALKAVRGGIDASVRRIIHGSGGAVFLRDGRTLRISMTTKRRITGKDMIRDRIYKKALTAAAGETAEAVRQAILLTEQTYTSPSTEPKWTALKELGFSAWSEVADVEEVEGKIEIG